MTVTHEDYTISLRLPPELAERAKDRAKSEERSLSALIRVALVSYLDGR
jgi:predicted DNA-binding protein